MAGREDETTNQRNMERLHWRKSSHSNSTACVEMACTQDSVLVRDTKDRTGAVLTFSFAEWSAFLGGVRGGEFDIA